MATKDTSKPNEILAELKFIDEYEELLACLQEYLMHHPQDYEALSDAGTVLFCLGRVDEANKHFRAAAKVAAVKTFGKRYVQSRQIPVVSQDDHVPVGQYLKDGSKALKH